eukprot:TRINITY_DN7818_c0_g1_i3.p2 TRINITY_DN7818_c0_g1~~TRINITY_DN7818_c0_g1_i3.p2  ORF type:complete len:188 (-),score=37.98 TRINITY_DN7818_c0_g1_i3:214-747(-)
MCIRDRTTAYSQNVSPRSASISPAKGRKQHSVSFSVGRSSYKRRKPRDLLIEDANDDPTTNFQHSYSYPIDAALKELEDADMFAGLDGGRNPEKHQGHVQMIPDPIAHFGGRAVVNENPLRETRVVRMPPKYITNHVQQHQPHHQSKSQIIVVHHPVIVEALQKDKKPLSQNVIHLK